MLIKEYDNENWVDGVSLIIAVFIIVSVDSVINYIKEMNNGDILPADIILVEGNGLKIDESTLTDESNAVTKKLYEKCLEELDNGSSKPSSNILLFGTNVIEGEGSAVIIAVGSNSQKDMKRLTIENEEEYNETPLDFKLCNITDLLVFFGLCSAIIIFIALLIRTIISYVKVSGLFSLGNLFKTISHIVILCVAIIFVTIPEVLLLIVTLI